MNRSQLTETLRARHPYLTRADAARVVEAMFGEMADALIRGRRVEIRGFGSLSARARAARRVHVPKTGARMTLPPRRVALFRAGRALRRRLNPASGG